MRVRYGPNEPDSASTSCKNAGLEPRAELDKCVYYASIYARRSLRLNKMTCELFGVDETKQRRATYACANQGATVAT